MLWLRMLAVGALALAVLPGAAQAQQVESVYVPAHEETRVERVQDPGRWVEEPRTFEAPGHYETRVQWVEVPGHWRSVEREVWVPGHWSARGGPSVGLGFGRRYFGVNIGIPLGTWIPGHHAMVLEQVWAPPRTEQRSVEVWVPGAKTVEYVRVFRPGPVREVATTVWVPGGYVRRQVSSPPVHLGY